MVSKLHIVSITTSSSLSNVVFLDSLSRMEAINSSSMAWIFLRSDSIAVRLGLNFNSLGTVFLQLEIPDLRGRAITFDDVLCGFSF